jgi:hypothetical protein
MGQALRDLVGSNKAAKKRETCMISSRGWIRSLSTHMIFIWSIEQFMIQNVFPDTCDPEFGLMSPVSIRREVTDENISVTSKRTCSLLSSQRSSHEMAVSLGQYSCTAFTLAKLKAQLPASRHLIQIFVCPLNTQLGGACLQFVSRSSRRYA